MPKDGNIGAKLTSGGLTLTFTWRGDRFEHAFDVGDASIKTAETADLETPAYQEVHQQGDLVFASGMSGDRHWSASVEPIEGGLLVDVACRCKSAVDRLGSAYGDWDRSKLHVIGKSADQDDPPKLTTDDGLFLVEPAVIGQELPCTVRYRYAVLQPQAEWISRGA